MTVQLCLLQRPSARRAEEGRGWTAGPRWSSRCNADEAGDALAGRPSGGGTEDTLEADAPGSLPALGLLAAFPGKPPPPAGCFPPFVMRELDRQGGGDLRPS